jgi:hypothetical protein
VHSLKASGLGHFAEIEVCKAAGRVEATQRMIDEALMLRAAGIF